MYSNKEEIYFIANEIHELPSLTFKDYLLDEFLQLVCNQMARNLYD